MVAPPALANALIGELCKLFGAACSFWTGTVFALLATFLFEVVKWGIGVYLGSFGSYSKIYGALAVVPIFLLWIYLTWTAVLTPWARISCLSSGA